MHVRFDTPDAEGGNWTFDYQRFHVGELQAQAASVVGVGGIGGQAQIKLTALNSRNLMGLNGEPAVNVTGIPWEFYNDPTSTAGEPADSGVFSTDENAEAVIQITKGVSLADEEHGLLVLYHPTDPTIRGAYRVPVVVT